MQTFVKIFGDRLARERRRLGLTQAEAAGKLGVSRSALALYETGRSEPGVSFLDRVEACGMDPLAILGGLTTARLAADAFDWELLQTVLNGIDLWAKEHRLKLPLEKKLAIARLLYAQFVDTREVDSAVLTQVMRAAA